MQINTLNYCRFFLRCAFIFMGRNDNMYIHNKSSDVLHLEKEMIACFQLCYFMSSQFQQFQMKRSILCWLQQFSLFLGYFNSAHSSNFDDARGAQCPTTTATTTKNHFQKNKTNKSLNWNKTHKYQMWSLFVLLMFIYQLLYFLNQRYSLFTIHNSWWI